MSSVSSCSLWATLHVKFSFVCRNSADSRLMYIIVDMTDLCPSICLTCRMSFVAWYSIVPFQWRSVWKLICKSRGLLKRVASCFRFLQKLPRKVFLFDWNMV